MCLWMEEAPSQRGFVFAFNALKVLNVGLERWLTALPEDWGSVPTPMAAHTCLQCQSQGIQHPWQNINAQKIFLKCFKCYQVIVSMRWDWSRRNLLNLCFSIGSLPHTPGTVYTIDSLGFQGRFNDHTESQWKSVLLMSVCHFFTSSLAQTGPSQEPCWTKHYCKPGLVTLGFTPVLRSLTQEDCKFKASLDYKVKSCLKKRRITFSLLPVIATEFW